ncbi:hypothetical protein [Sphingobium sp. S6]|uniref:hypothetical protein n=1 Tax=Sphingobium sp. S6 TaxID=2758386 RepID=UPI001F2C7DCC|nr:hypothetical protein [Sphingobium sp. S6]
MLHRPELTPADEAPDLSFWLAEDSEQGHSTTELRLGEREQNRETLNWGNADPALKIKDL